MIYSPRSVWEEPGKSVTGSLAVPEEWRYNTLHYCGVAVDTSDPVRLLRNMQSAWLGGKGYSLGYNFAVFPDGGIWEIRGFDLRCAANGSQAVNRPGVAILLAFPAIDGVPTDAMVWGVRSVVGQTRSLVPHELTINGHHDVRPDPTACPGETIYDMIAAGTFEPAAAPAPAPAPTPTPGDDDVSGQLGYFRDDRPDGWQIWVVDIDSYGSVWTCPIGDLPDAGKWHVVQPIVGNPPIRPFGDLVALMDAQNRPAP